MGDYPRRTHPAHLPGDTDVYEREPLALSSPAPVTPTAPVAERSPHGPAKALSETRALVTGASGFLGSHLCRRLLTERTEVHAVSRISRDRGADDGMHWWQCDTVDAAAILDLVSRVKPDVVFHLGGMVTAAPDVHLVAPTFHSLLTSTVNILTAVTEVGCNRVVLSASLEEPTAGSADALVPASPYGAAKLAAGAYARMFVKLYATPVVCLRPFMAYGPSQRPSKIVPYTILSLLRGEAPQLSSGDRALDWVYVDDVIDAFVRAAWHPGVEGRTLDLGSGTAIRIRDIVDRVVRLIDPSIVPSYGAARDRPDARTRVADVEATAAALDWRVTTSLDRGLASTVEWYRRSTSTADVSGA
jgi:UDP-glucose 4-epimerase